MKRAFRLGLFAALAFGIAVLGLAVGAAWAYVDALTHPPCNHSPEFLAGRHEPAEVWLEPADGLRLRAWYYAPADMGRANGAAIIAMGGPGGALGNNLPPVDFLLKEGFGVLQVDSRACAQPPARVTLGADELMDAQAALWFLKSQPDVRHIGMIGFSMGGVTAIRVAARHNEIEAVVAEGGYYNLGKDITDADRLIHRLERAFLYLVAWTFHLQTGVDPFAVSPVDDLPKISPRPVLLIYGSEEIDSGRGELQYQATREPRELWVVMGGKHGTNYGVAGDEYRQRVLGLFTQYLVR